MLLPPDTVLAHRFEITRRLGEDEEGEDYAARDREVPAYVRVRVLRDPALAAAHASAQALVDATVAAGARALPGLPVARGTGVHAGTGRVWFAEAYAHGAPAYQPADGDVAIVLERLREAARLLDPARALGLQHGRLGPASVLHHLGEPAIVGLAAGAWLGAVRPRGPGGDLGALARAVIARLAPAQRVPPVRAWLAACEAAAHPSLGAALDALPAIPPTREAAARARAAAKDAARAAAALARAKEAADEAAEEAARAAAEEQARALRDGWIAPADLPATIEDAAWPDLLARVAAYAPRAAWSLTPEGALAGHGVSWPLAHGEPRQAAWSQARHLLGAMDRLAGATRIAAGDVAAQLRAVARRLDLARAPRPRPAGLFGRILGGAAPGGPASAGSPIHTGDDDAMVWVTRATAGDEALEVSRGSLHVARVVLGWATSHAQGRTLDRRGSFDLAHLPAREDDAGALVAALLGALRAAGRRPERLGTCRFCARGFRGADLHDDTCCHRCAELHLGVVH